MGSHNLIAVSLLLYARHDSLMYYSESGADALLTRTYQALSSPLQIRTGSRRIHPSASRP